MFDSGDQIDKRKSRGRVCVSGYWGNETARIMSQHMLIFYSVNKLPHSGLLLTLFFPTDAKKIEISLAMLCSSKEALLCDKATTRDRVFEQVMHKDKEAAEGKLQQDCVLCTN